MNSESVRVYFMAYPHLKECFETVEGVLHPAKEVAEKWCEMKANKNIKVHSNPANVVAQEPTEEIVQEPTEEATQEPTEEITEHSSEDEGTKSSKRKK